MRSMYSFSVISNTSGARSSERRRRQLNRLVAILEEALRPLIDEEDRGAALIVEDQAGAIGAVGERRRLVFRRVDRCFAGAAPPARHRPRHHLHSAGGAVLVLEPVLEDFELERADGGEER